MMVSDHGQRLEILDICRSPHGYILALVFAVPIAGCRLRIKGRLETAGVLPKLTYETPSPSLMRELREVESDAGALEAELKRANLLPSDFPAKQLQELLVELQSLPAGTAEGSRQPLEYARSRLPAIRRQFIKTEEDSHESPADEDAPPPLTRGMTIDVRIGALVNSVTTALDEYRALASIQDNDAADTAPSLEIDATSADVVDAMAASQRAEQALGEHINELEKIAEPASVAADNLKRQMRDTRGLLSLARIELRMPAFVPRWYRKTIDTVRDYPRILRATLGAVRMGIDVARPMVDAWHHFERGFSYLVLDSIEHAATELVVVTRKWEVEIAERKGEPDADAAAPPPDFDLEVARAMILRGETPVPSWRPWIKQLYFSGEAINDLAPLAPLSALQELNLDAAKVSDVSPLARLTALQRLTLSNTQVSDVSPLQGARRLQRLYLSGTGVSDVSPLARLVALQRLTLSNTQISDVSPLARLTGLQRLSVSNTQVSDVSPLARLTALQHLTLSNTQISDVSPLARLTSLQVLDLTGTEISDVLPLRRARRLQRLYLSGTWVSDVSPLAHLTGLQHLTLSNTQISDVSPLARLTALQILYLSGTQVSDVSPLARLTALRILYLTGTQVSDVSSLARLAALQRLSLNRTRVSDVSSLARLTALHRLDLRGTQITDVSPLACLTGLQRLDLKDSQVTKVSPLNHIHGLQIFGVRKS
jgi:Leucine-rich repeat (LRR) protein